MQSAIEVLETLIARHAKRAGVEPHPIALFLSEDIEDGIKQQLAWMMDLVHYEKIIPIDDPDGLKAQIDKYIVQYNDTLIYARESAILAMKLYWKQLVPIADIENDTDYEELRQMIEITPREDKEAIRVLKYLIQIVYLSGGMSHTNMVTLIFYLLKNECFTLEACKLLGREYEHLIYKPHGEITVDNLTAILDKLFTHLPEYPRETSAVFRHYLSLGDELGYWECPEGLETDVEADNTVTTLLMAVKYGHTDISTSYPQHGYLSFHRKLEANHYKDILKAIRSDNPFLAHEDSDFIDLILVDE